MVTGLFRHGVVQVLYLDVVTPDYFLCNVGNMRKFSVAEHMGILWVVDVAEAFVVGAVHHRHSYNPLLNAIKCLKNEIFSSLCG